MATKTLYADPVLPSPTIERQYQSKLNNLVTKMANTTEYWIEQEYSKNLSQIVTLDSPLSDILSRLNSVIGTITKLFYDDASELAKWFIASTEQDTSRRLGRSLYSAAEISIPLEITPYMQTVLQGRIAENVSLIRSIPEKYFGEVSKIVYESIERGRDLQYLTNTLENRYDITRRQARAIASDQITKATSQITTLRKQTAGLFLDQWNVSSVPKTHRPLHLLANHEIYDNRQGCLIGGKYTYPGEEINCKCYARLYLGGYAV